MDKEDVVQKKGRCGTDTQWNTTAIKKEQNKTAEARTTILQPVEQKPHSQKDRQDEKAEGYVPDEGTI